MDTLFTQMEDETRLSHAPLAVRMRPRTLDELVGQQEAVGEGTWLRAAIENDTLSSIILYGPAGTGKTSLARVIAHSTHATFVEVSAIGGTVSDLRKVIAEADERLVHRNLRTILFIDEMHMLMGAGAAEGAADAANILKPALSRGEVQVIGATTLDEYRKNIEKDAALERRFQPVQINEPSAEDAVEILKVCATSTKHITASRFRTRLLKPLSSCLSAM